jgi:hypothetical protein
VAEGVRPGNEVKHRSAQVCRPLPWIDEQCVKQAAGEVLTAMQAPHRPGARSARRALVLWNGGDGQVGDGVHAGAMVEASRKK